MNGIKSKINTVIQHPSLIKSLIYRKKLNEIQSDL